MRRQFDRAAASYDAAAVLAQETGRRLADRLQWVKIKPGRMADVGCATGDGILALQKLYPQALPLAMDFAYGMLGTVRQKTGWWQRMRGQMPRLINADVHALPVASGVLDLVWSNLMLHWLDEPLLAFQELHRTMAVGGLLTFAMLGPDTLKELRAAGASQLRQFPDMHDVGDMLVEAGFADPVMDMEIIRLSYRQPRKFLADQRQLGVRNALLGQQSWREWREILRRWAGDTDSEGNCAVSFEIVFGHAWKPAPRVATDGRAIVQFSPKRPTVPPILGRLLLL